MSEELRRSYAKIAEDYQRKKQDAWRDYVSFARSCSWEPQGALLDVGAGNGRNLQYAPADLNVAFDLSFALLLDYQGGTGDQRVAGALPSLPFRARAFDSWICMAVLHHFREPEAVVSSLQRIREISTAEGIISVWRKWRKGHREKILRALEQGEDPTPLIDHERPWYTSDRQEVTTRFYHYYTFRELRSQLIQAGFRMLQTGYLGGRHQDANIFTLVSPAEE